MLNSFALVVTLITQPISPGIGDAILLKLPSGQNMLIDTGIPSAYKTQVLPALEKAGITELHYLVITHAHWDHDGSADTIVERYKGSLKEIWHNGSDPNAKYKRTALNYGIPLVVPKRGDLRRIGPLDFQIMNPKAGESLKDENDNSLAFKLKYGSFSMLFTGDVEYQAADNMIKAIGPDLKSTVYKVAHHGSAKFRDDFVKLVNPKYALCSCRTTPVPSRHLQAVLRDLKSEWYSNRDYPNLTIEAKSDGTVRINP